MAWVQVVHIVLLVKMVYVATRCMFLVPIVTGAGFTLSEMAPVRLVWCGFAGSIELESHSW